MNQNSSNNIECLLSNEKENDQLNNINNNINDIQMKIPPTNNKHTNSTSNKNENNTLDSINQHSHNNKNNLNSLTLVSELQNTVISAFDRYIK